ncbi:MAG: hypothetical protein ABIL25_05035 [candidate division WOR-3 bacterium]
MKRVWCVVLVAATAGSAAMMLDTVDYRFSAKGLTGVGFRSSDVSVTAVVRADTGQDVLFRCFKTRVAGDTTGFRTGDLEVSVLDADSQLALISASCSRGDSCPRCSLDILLPRAVGFYADLSCGSKNRVMVDGLGAMAFVHLYTGDVRVLNHRGPADVCGRSVVCVVDDQKPTDTLLLKAEGTLTLYYPDSIRAEVHVLPCSSPAVEGLKTSFGMSTCITDYILNPDAPGPNRYVNLASNGIVRARSAYSEDEK